MKRFAFTLDKAKRFREAQLRLEEARRAMLIAAEASIQNRMRELRTGLLAQRQTVARVAETEGSSLALLHQFGEFVGVELNRLERESELLRKEIATQWEKAKACRQRVELLDKLEDRQLTAWNREAARELQEEAEESFNAGWLRERHPANVRDERFVDSTKQP
jgi:hypothetical protein